MAYCRWLCHFLCFLLAWEEWRGSFSYALRFHLQLEKRNSSLHAGSSVSAPRRFRSRTHWLVVKFCVDFYLLAENLADKETEMA